VNLGRPIVTNGAFATLSSQITLRTSLSYACTQCSTSYPCRTISTWVQRAGGRSTNAGDWCLPLNDC